MTGRGEPSWQPIGGLPVIASLIDGGLRDGREHYATLLEARPKPYVLDDATIAATKRVNGEGLEWCGVYVDVAKALARCAGGAVGFSSLEGLVRHFGVMTAAKFVIRRIGFFAAFGCVSGVVGGL